VTPGVWDVFAQHSRCWMQTILHIVYPVVHQKVSYTLTLLAWMLGFYYGTNKIIYVHSHCLCNSLLVMFLSQSQRTVPAKCTQRHTIVVLCCVYRRLAGCVARSTSSPTSQLMTWPPHSIMSRRPSLKIQHRFSHVSAHNILHQVQPDVTKHRTAHTTCTALRVDANGG